MFIANPIWLWGLTALSIPIGIHLLSRKESQVMRLGSLRHLQSSITKQSVNIRLNELVLLMLRCLMVVLIVLLFSGLHFAPQNTAHERWLIVERGLEQDPRFKPMIDSLKKENFELKNVQTEIENGEALNADSTVNYWKLAEHIRRYAPEKVIVISNSQLQHFKGKRMAKPEQLTWLSKDPEPHTFAVQAVVFKNDSVALRTGVTTGSRTSFANLSIPRKNFPDSLTLDSRDTVAIILAVDKTFAYDESILRAALYALDDANLPLLTIKTISTEESIPAAGDWLVWLSTKPAPENVNANLLRMDPTVQPYGQLLIRGQDCKSEHMCWIITRRLTVDEALRHKLYLELSAIIFDNVRKKLTHVVSKNDRRVQPETMMWSNTRLPVDNGSAFEVGRSIVLQILAAMILAVLVIERFIALKRNQ